jgi:hypothetical protein
MSVSFFFFRFFMRACHIFPDFLLNHPIHLSLGRIVFSGMLRLVAHVRTDVSEELSTSFIRVTRIGELGKTLAVTSNRRTLRRNTMSGLGISSQLASVASYS